MKYELFDFQKDAVNTLLKRMRAMHNSYVNDGELSAVSLTAPTGAGKTVISAAAAESLFFGNDTFEGDNQAAILWLSDSPSLNEQTMKRFDAATDMLDGTTMMETVGPEFAKSHERLMPGHIYFLNRQLLSKSGKLTNDAEGGRTFWDVLTNTIEDTDTHLFLFIDEAHRGLGKDATSDSANKTIYAKLIDGQDGLNPPMPCVIGISATPERFKQAMADRKDRAMKVPIDVPVSGVRSSGLIKDVIELRTPKEQADTRHQDLTQACVRLARAAELWKEYCTSNGIPTVVPLMVVQVEDKVSLDTLENLCSQILKVCPWLDRDCFANVFGEHEDITTQVANIPYCPPEDVSGNTRIRILFAKDAVSTGWDCPRAEVIYSRRTRKDPTYIAQLIGRMIRTPLARRIESIEELNSVACYLPEYDSDTVEAVVSKLKEDNVPVAEKDGILKNPARVTWFAEPKHKAEKELNAKRKHEAEQIAPATTSGGTPATAQSTNDKEPDASAVTYEQQIIPGNDTNALNPSMSNASTVSPADDESDMAFDDQRTIDELKAVLDRTPKVDDNLIKESFEHIITRQVQHDKPNVFLDLCDCVDIITSDIDNEDDLNSKVTEAFCNNIDAQITAHPSEFERAYQEICNTTIAIKRIDPLTGEEYEDREESVQNDIDRMTEYYRKAVQTFAGATDIVKAYINRYKQKEELATDEEAIARICAASESMEVIQGLEQWAENETHKLIDEYGPKRYAITSENRPRWDRIEGHTQPYIEHTLSIGASVTRQNMNYDRYPKHIISDENGWAYLNLNNLEKKIVCTELSSPLTVAWYRNQSRNLNASLSIPYELGGQWENMYPDFIFFVKTKNGKIIRTIVDPHGDWLGDSVAKLKGYVLYLRDHPDMFGSVLAVADEKDDECRYLDLMEGKVQDAIEKFTGSSAKDLFLGDLSKPYTIKETDNE